MTTTPSSPPPPHLEVEIRSVWAFNLRSEFALIREAIRTHPFVAMDTEFPGVIYKSSIHHTKLKPQQRYEELKANVDALQLIQVGLTLSDSDGNLPILSSSRRPCAWEFNFKDFDPLVHPHAPDSISLLKSNGIDFDLNRMAGIDSAAFGHLLWSSGLLFDNSVTWVTFQGAYDLGYLMKILVKGDLPESMEQFLFLMGLMFGRNVYDVKHMMRFCENLHGGLEKLATLLQVRRMAGKSHQAGSDSLLTCHAFMKMKERFFPEDDWCTHAGVLHGLESFPRLFENHDLHAFFVVDDNICYHHRIHCSRMIDLVVNQEEYVLLC